MAQEQENGKKDEGQKRNEKRIASVERKIVQTYSEAQRDIEAKLDDFNRKMGIKAEKYMKMVDEGKITWEQYSSWMDGQLFQSEMWESKREEILTTIANANKEAVAMVNAGAMVSFADGTNWMHYYMEQSVGSRIGFEIYNKDAVALLITENPQILPKWKIDEPKTYIWNAQKVRNCVTQGIIQGESLDKISKRIATSLSNSNKSLALTHAQTAMGGAQNAGRNFAMMRAKKLGVDVVKQWMATLDRHTRDSHRDMDGETQKVGDTWHPMKFSNGCRYPCDPEGPAREVFNCRCALVSDVKGYESDFQRRDNISGEPIENMTYREWEEELQKEAKYSEAQHDLENIEKEIKDKGADKVFSGIWKDDITYADWEAKKGSIQGKKDYYDIQITDAKMDFYEMFPDIDEADEAWNAVDKFMKDPTDENRAAYRKVLKELGLDDDEMDVVSDTYLKCKKKVDKWQGYIDELEEFEKHGEEYSKLYKQKEEAKKRVSEYKPKPKGVKSAVTFDEDAYSEERKGAALSAKTRKEADRVLRPLTGSVWDDLTPQEKNALYEYTRGSGGFNRPLRGYTRGWETKKGVGVIPLDAEGRGEDIKHATEAIKKCTLDRDVWLVRGVSSDGMAGFLQVDKRVLESADQDTLESLLLGKVVPDTAFMSCGSAEGTGFGSGIRIYCPKGTQAIYVEPFSHFSGENYGLRWDGVSGGSIGGEQETLLQRNSFFRVTKVSRQWGEIQVEVEVVDQKPDDWTPWE